MANKYGASYPTLEGTAVVDRGLQSFKYSVVREYYVYGDKTCHQEFLSWIDEMGIKRVPAQTYILPGD